MCWNATSGHHGDALQAPLVVGCPCRPTSANLPTETRRVVGLADVRVESCSADRLADLGQNSKNANTLDPPYPTQSMIPTPVERAQFERNAELGVVADQIARLIAGRGLTDAEVDRVMADAKAMLETPAAETVVDRAKRLARGW